MTIAVQLTSAFDIETYDGLLAYIIAHLELDSESAANVPTFIRKGEYRLNRLVVAPERETNVSLSTTAGTQNVALPTDFRQMRNARLVGDNGRTLKQVSLDTLYTEYAGQTGSPCVYAISEQGLQVAPTPDAVTTIKATYLAKIPPLSPSNQTNWLLSTNADVYVYATLWQAAAWLEDIDAAMAFRSEMMAIIDELNFSGERYRYGAPLAPRVHGIP